MSRCYYIYWYRLDERDGYLIWFSNEKDGFVTEKTGFIPDFQSVADLQNYSGRHQIIVDVENPNLHDLDTVENWLNGSSDKIEDYNPFLEAWNLFEDVSTSTKSAFDKDKVLTNDIYNKIFWGCNISAVTPKGESFTPGWKKKELNIIRQTLKLGFQIFRQKVKAQ